MADKKPTAEAAPTEPAAQTKKKPPIKVIAIVAVLMIVEAAAVFFVLGMGGPSEGKAETHEKHLEHDDSEETREIEIVSEKYQNLQTGRVWIWDMAIFVQVKNKHAEQVERVLKQRAAEIKEGLGQIVSRAQHTQLKEPERQTLNRQFSAFLDKIIGTDSDGKPLVERLMIPKCRGFPADF